MSVSKVVAWVIIALCAAVFAICVYAEPERAADSLEHFVLHAAYIGLVVSMIVVTTRYIERGGVPRR